MSYLVNMRTFVRIFELGSMSAAARDQRISPAVASARLSQLEGHLGVRLFQRTTRSLSATEQGQRFYDGARRVLSAVDEAEGSVSEVTSNPRGTLHIAAPLVLGRRLVAPQVPAFLAAYPLIDLRLRLSDRKLDLTAERLDLAFYVGRPADSDMRIRTIAECRRVLCASPDYIATHGHPRTGAEIDAGKHVCLNLRFPGATEFRWNLLTPDGVEAFNISGRCECDDGDVLTDWALAGAGIALKPIFEIADHLRSGRLVPVVEDTPPLPVQVACLYTHKRHQDPKVRLFMDFMIERILGDLTEDVARSAQTADQLPR